MSTVLNLRQGRAGRSGTFFGTEAKLDLSGLGRVAQALKPEHVAPILERRLKPVEHSAYVHCPKRTGRLASTIETVVSVESTQVIAQVVAGGPEAPYGPYVEFRGGPYKPYMRPAWEEHKDTLREGIANDIARLIQGL